MPQYQYQQFAWAYWPTGVATAEVRVESWMQPPQIPAFNLEPQPGLWVGILEPTLMSVPPSDTWHNQTKYNTPPLLSLDIPFHQAFFWNPADFTAPVPAMDSWFRETNQPLIVTPPTDGYYVYLPPQSLFTDTIPCPWLAPNEPEADDPRPSTEQADDLRPRSDDGDDYRPRKDECL